jgi:predicted metalloprotease
MHRRSYRRATTTDHEVPETPKMRWKTGDRSNIEDRRGASGLRTGVPLGVGGIILLALLSWATGTDFLSLLGPAVEQGADQQQQEPGGAPVRSSPQEERTVDFVDAVMGDLQATWAQMLGPRYERTTLVLFRDSIDSQCGFAQSASGPFYCPGDRKVFIDLGFYQELRDRFGASGDFAQAYVVAHEVGHHVQTLLGIEPRVRAAQQRSPSDANELSVRLELQADCFAGVWGHAASQPGRFLNGRIELEPGDVQEGLHAAAAIGDDRIQRMSTGRVFPDTFTHGTSAQRVEWFRRGLDGGRADDCDTFGTR